MKDVSPILRSLGFVDSEIKTYLTALEKGPSTVIDLATSTKLSRQATYVAIESLVGRGIMASTLRGKKRFYSADHPAKLLAYAKRRDADVHERVKDLERMVPDLELLAGGERPVVKVFEGKEGVRAIIADMEISRPKQTDEITDLEALYSTLTQDDLLPMRKTLKRLGTRIRGFYAGVPGPKVANVDRFFLPKEYAGFKANITVSEGKVSLITFEGKMYSILIENKAIARAMRILFQLALKNVKKSE